jgi:hypothetical protein
MTEHEATIFLIDYLRKPIPSSAPSFGYDVYIPRVLRRFFKLDTKPGYINDDDVWTLDAGRVSPLFYAAAWNLCRRGIIRPGVKQMGAQETADGSAGNGYSITPFGSQWLREAASDDFVPTEPERFGDLRGVFAARFGNGFQERGQQAVRCYGAHAYLACCAMTGAAAESVLLATAIAKRSEAEVMRAYGGAKGRSRVEQMIVGQLVDPIRRDLLALSGLLKYWRDEAAHGKSSGIGDNEAYTSLAMLLRLSQFTNDHWDELTS